ncbi:MAG: adenylate/guanylate cyclase domain-containing protein [Hyphomicrobiales bacterium]|nr:adenylate/guanylate cyclase domain-containing protein [Hyphomicrobiales bacterium]
MEEARLRRKIAVIMAADVSGYSRLVAEDEDGTLKRLMDYREIFADFVSRGHGRIFNTAGDAVLAEFDSAVEAVRAAMDIQEALKARNGLLPQQRRMVFRIGVSLGDVVEREGDLLGDGVNIAARLQGLAQPGGICVSRAVQEQVANKVSILFRDIGAQSVKNIPQPVHAFIIGDIQSGDAGASASNTLARQPPAKARKISSTALLTVGGAALLCVAGAIFFFSRTSAPKAPENPAASLRSSARGMPVPDAENASASAHGMNSLAGTPLKPMEIPFVTRDVQHMIERQYMVQNGPKALAISGAAIGMSRNAADENAAKTEALSQCESRAVAGRKCMLFAVGDTIVWDHPAPRIASEGPLAPRFIKMAAAGEDSVPFIQDEAHKKILDDYLKASSPKALVAGPHGALEFAFGGASADDIIRRALQLCADRARLPCLLVAVNDDAVTRMPQSMMVRGLLEMDGQDQLPGVARQQLASAAAQNSWYALATGAGGAFGVGVSPEGEKEAINAALAACREKGSGMGCVISAIGPFMVRPKS